MTILFLMVPLAFLGVAFILSRARLMGGLQTSSVGSLGDRDVFCSNDERGITLQTVIVTAVLALAAAGAGIVIFNVISGEANDIKVNADVDGCAFTVTGGFIDCTKGDGTETS